MIYYFKKDNSTTKIKKKKKEKIFMQYMEKVLGPSQCVKSGLQSFEKKKKKKIFPGPCSTVK